MTTTTLTPELATALLAQVTLIPKRCTFECGTPVMTDGGASVVLRTNASTPTIQGWFSKVGATVTRLDQVMGRNSWVCYWRVAE